MRPTSRPGGHVASGHPAVRSFALALGGLLLVQLAWILAVPPFEGLDELGHSVKAAAVARGDWHVTHDGDSDGGYMTVPRDLVEAGQPVCESLRHTADHHCTVLATRDPRLVTVASSASSYNPVFYFVIGTPSRLFSGAHALYAMRATAALLCALLMAAGFAAASAWSRTTVLPAAALLTLTPVTLYTSMVAAPNGIELAGAFLVWMSLLGVGRLPLDDDRGRSTLVRLATVGAVPLALVRGLGPLWLLLVVGTCLLVTPRPQLRALLRSRGWWLGFAISTVAAAANVGWAQLAHTNTVNGNGPARTGLWSDLPRQWFLWFFQSVAVFPGRVDFAPTYLYALVMGAWLILVVLAWRGLRRSELVALGLVLVGSTLIAATVTIATYAGSGPIWQGRYGYPYAMGFLLVCAVAVDRRDFPTRWASAGLLAAGLVSAGAELIGLVTVADRQRLVSPLRASQEWLQPSDWLLVVLVCAGALSLLLAARPPTFTRRPEPDPQPHGLPVAVEL